MFRINIDHLIEGHSVMRGELMYVKVSLGITKPFQGLADETVEKQVRGICIWFFGTLLVSARGPWPTALAGPEQQLSAYSLIAVQMSVPVP
jgi:hypothetical protein